MDYVPSVQCCVMVPFCAKTFTVEFGSDLWYTWKRGRVARRGLPRVEHSVRHNLKSNIRRRARRPEMNRKRRCIKPQVSALQFINACGRTPAFDAIAELLPRYPARLICNWRCASHFQLQLCNTDFLTMAKASLCLLLLYYIAQK